MAFLIAKHMGYKGEAIFEPVGVQRKMTCIKKMKSLNLKPEISLKQGIQIASKYYKDQYDKN